MKASRFGEHTFERPYIRSKLTILISSNAMYDLGVTRILGVEEKIDIDRTATDRMIIEQIEARAGKEEEIMELRELTVMAMEGGPVNTARGFLTWGILRQVTP